VYCFGLDPVTTALYPASFYLKIMNILQLAMADASFRIDLDFL
jgi:hypothetical protein